MTDTEKLGRFGHHPDPAIDFEIEVDSLIGMAFDASHGIGKPGHPPRSREEVADRISKALDFRVGGDQSCVEAKRQLRELAVSFVPPTIQSVSAADMVASPEMTAAMLEAFADIDEAEGGNPYVIEGERQAAKLIRELAARAEAAEARLAEEMGK